MKLKQSIAFRKPTINVVKRFSLKNKKTEVVPSNYCPDNSIECTEVQVMEENPQYIQTIEYINGFKVVTITPVLSEQEYKSLEQRIVENIINCLSKYDND